MVNSLSKVSKNPSNKWLMLILLVTLSAVIWTALRSDGTSDGVGDELVASKRLSNVQRHNFLENRHHSPVQQENISRLIPWQSLKRELLTEKIQDVFKVHSWVVIPPAKKLKPQPLSPPVAPPAPYTYVGKLEDTPKGTQVFLINNGKLYSVVKGEKINAQWRFESDDANSLRFTYLPLNLVQTLSKSAKPEAPLAIKPTAKAELNQ